MKSATLKMRRSPAHPRPRRFYTDGELRQLQYDPREEMIAWARGKFSPLDRAEFSAEKRRRRLLEIKAMRGIANDLQRAIELELPEAIAACASLLTHMMHNSQDSFDKAMIDLPNTLRGMKDKFDKTKGVIKGNKNRHAEKRQRVDKLLKDGLKAIKDKSLADDKLSGIVVSVAAEADGSERYVWKRLAIIRKEKQQSAERQ